MSLTVSGAQHVPDCQWRWQTHCASDILHSMSLTVGPGGMQHPGLGSDICHSMSLTVGPDMSLTVSGAQHVTDCQWLWRTHCAFDILHSMSLTVGPGGAQHVPDCQWRAACP
eukprot:2166936-Rhodomonas_salina.1